MSNNDFIKVLSDRQHIAKLIDEAKQELDRLNTIIKDYMGDRTDLILSEYHVIYKTVTKTVADTDKMKKDGIYSDYSKSQITRPLYVK